MEYVEGCSLSALLAKNKDNRPPRLIVPIVLDLLAGLHAAHIVTDDDDKPLHVVHRDVSPQNVLVGTDGVARITDFGIAKAEARLHSTRPGEVKGKFAYMSPEQISDVGKVDQRTDVFASGVVLWSALTARRLFSSDTTPATIHNLLSMVVPPPSTKGLMPPAVLDPIILRALERDLDKRFSSAAEMEEALREVAAPAGLLASKREIAEWVKASFDEELSKRRAAIRSVETSSRDSLITGQSARSGLRALPEIGSSEISHSDAKGSESKKIIVTASGTLPSAVPPAPAGRGVLMAVAALGLVSIGVTATLLLRPPPVQAARPATEAAATALAPSPPAAPSPVAAAAPSPTPSAAAVTAPTAPPATAAPAARPGPASRHQASAPPAPPPAATTAAPDARKKKWENDSPLPPP